MRRARVNSDAIDGGGRRGVLPGIAPIAPRARQSPAKVQGLSSGVAELRMVESIARWAGYPAGGVDNGRRARVSHRATAAWRPMPPGSFGRGAVPGGRSPRRSPPRGPRSPRPTRTRALGTDPAGPPRDLLVSVELSRAVRPGLVSGAHAFRHVGRISPQVPSDSQYRVHSGVRCGTTPTRRQNSVLPSAGVVGELVDLALSVAGSARTARHGGDRHEAGETER